MCKAGLLQMHESCPWWRKLSKLSSDRVEVHDCSNWIPVDDALAGGFGDAQSDVRKVDEHSYALSWLNEPDFAGSGSAGSRNGRGAEEVGFAFSKTESNSVCSGCNACGSRNLLLHELRHAQVSAA